MFANLDHIGRTESELRSDNSAVHQDLSLTESSRVFSARDYIQESGHGENGLYAIVQMADVVHMCIYKNK